MVARCSLVRLLTRRGPRSVPLRSRVRAPPSPGTLFGVAPARRPRALAAPSTSAATAAADLTAPQAPSPAQALSVSRHGHHPWVHHAKQTIGRTTSEWWSSTTDRDTLQAVARAAGVEMRRAHADPANGNGDYRTNAGDFFDADDLRYDSLTVPPLPALTSTTVPPLPALTSTTVPLTAAPTLTSVSAPAASTVAFSSPVPAPTARSSGLGEGQEPESRPLSFTARVYAAVK